MGSVTKAGYDVPVAWNLLWIFSQLRAADRTQQRGKVR
jgi:hypothetical protein